MLKIAMLPYYCTEVWPVCSNTHGGPVHDAEQRILNVFGEPIARLFAAGELGGVFGISTCRGETLPSALSAAGPRGATPRVFQHGRR
jgi:hypothetical protein